MKAKHLSLEELNRIGPFAQRSIEKKLHQGQTLREAYQISTEHIKKYYDYGLELYHAQRYSDAADVFLFLSLVSPDLRNLWLCLGMSEQQNSNFRGAIEAYEMAIVLEPFDSLPYLNIVDCCLKSSDIEMATFYIELVKEMIPTLDGSAKDKMQRLKVEIENAK